MARFFVFINNWWKLNAALLLISPKCVLINFLDHVCWWQNKPAVMTREDFPATAVFLEYQSVNKLVGTTISFIIFETFRSFTKFTFNHKWNDGRLLLINMLYTICRSWPRPATRTPPTRRPRPRRTPEPLPADMDKFEQWKWQKSDQ